MCDVLDRIETRGKVEGFALGEAKGENKLASLISKLISLGRINDVAKAANDPEYREKLYMEFGIA